VTRKISQLSDEEARQVSCDIYEACKGKLLFSANNLAKKVDIQLSDMIKFLDSCKQYKRSWLHKLDPSIGHIAFFSNTILGHINHHIVVFRHYCSMC